MPTSYEKQQKDRRSIRLRGYDYTGIGWYFVTFCTQNRNPIFGRIKAGKMKLSPYGYIARHVWRRGKNIWKNVHLDAFIIMPNHIHAIIFIKTSVWATSHVTSVVGATSHVAHQAPHHVAHQAPHHVAHQKTSHVAHQAPHHVAQNEISNLEQATRGEIRATRGVEIRATRGVAPTAAQPRGPACKSIGAFIGSYKSVVSKIFNKTKNNTDPIWQRNYYERIIRNENELHNIREYIRMNPVRATSHVAHQASHHVAHQKTFGTI
jgi:REP element-mobilizing transposase RayT